MDEAPGDERASPLQLFEALGVGSPLVLEAVELWWVELPFVAPVATAIGIHRVRPLVLVRLRCRNPVDGSMVDGWGECAALADDSYDAEDVSGAWATLERVLLGALWDLSKTGEGVLPSVLAVQGLASNAPGCPLAFAALEMAVADAHLRGEAMSFAALIGVAGHTVRPGAVLGLPRSTHALLESVAALAVAGYQRVKVKVAPGSEIATVQALVDWAAAATGLVPMFQVDANGAYGPNDIALLAELDRFGLLCIEQPFDRSDLESHRRLAAAMTTPVCLDESLNGPESVIEAVTTGACSVVCVKPARLGGIRSALEVVEWCTSNDIAWWIGGMFESSYARRVNTALAALPGRKLPGDLSPSDTYLRDDLVVVSTLRRDAAGEPVVVEVCDVPGMGPDLDLSLLEALLLRRISVERGLRRVGGS